MQALSLKNIHYRYNDQQAVVDDISFDLKQGEILSLLGASGCGKTTLLKIITGLIRQQQGQVHIADQCVDHLPPEKRRVGMIFQDYALFPHLSVLDNIAFGLINSSLSHAEQKARVHQMLDHVRLGGMENRFIHELSGGQQQRVAIARALACKPEVLLLDEPFSNIDSHVRGQLVSEVRELLKSQGASAILVTHNREEAFCFSDQMALLQAGRVAQLGEPQQLYYEPNSTYVAEFLGAGNWLLGVVVDQYCVKTSLGILKSTVPHQKSVDSEVKVFLRPQQIKLEAASEGSIVSALKQQFSGKYNKYDIILNKTALKVHSFEPLTIDMNQKYHLSVKPHRLVFF